MVSGTVFEIDQKGAYLDIGAKSAAFCPTAEVSLCKIGRVRMLLSAILGVDRACRTLPAGAVDTATPVESDGIQCRRMRCWR